MALKDKLLKNTTIKLTALLEDSTIHDKKSLVQTRVPIVNLAASGSIDGGIPSGLLQITGPSRHFKTMFGLLVCSAFLDKYPEGMVLFYDTEFGASLDYFKSMGVDVDRVIHTPITNIEEFTHDIMKQLESIERNDKLMIFVDSIGNMASKKEVADAISGNEAADMTRAKRLKALGRIVTPHLTIKDIPMVIINHVYQTQETYSKTVVSGGTGLYLSADNIWIIGRQQDKDKNTNELYGYDFIINVEKSRYVKEKSKFPIYASFESGIYKHSGLFDLAIEGGYIIAKGAWFAYPDAETTGAKNFRRADVENDDAFWAKIIKETDFSKWLTKTFKLSSEDKALLAKQTPIQIEED